MKKYSIFYGCVAALLLYAFQVTAQGSGHTGVQTYHPPRVWRGLNLVKLFGSFNTATGTGALNSCTTCSYVVADGYQALYNCTSCYQEVAVGYEAAFDCQGCNNSVAIGMNALTLDINGYNNIAIGSYALENASGANNVAIGTRASQFVVGSGNTAIGTDALAALYNSAGLNNAIGWLSLYSNTSGSGNVGEGFGALYSSTTGSYNTAIGVETLLSNTTGTYNTALGFGANVGSGALTNATALGTNATVSSSNQVVVGNMSVTSIGGAVGWSNFSDGRYKKNIQANVPGLVFINKLNPVTYNLDVAGIETRLHPDKPLAEVHGAGSYVKAENDPVKKQALQEKAAITYTGFVAQDVEKAAESVGYVFSGVDKPKNAEQGFYGLRYDEFVPPLVKAVQELSAANDRKDSVINSLQTQINELRGLVLAQKSSALLGASLDQNAPNPFTSSTVIGYNLPPGASSAQLQITDASGKIVAVIPLSGSGKNTVTANASGLVSGTYQYSLLVNGQLVNTRQMMLVR